MEILRGGTQRGGIKKEWKGGEVETHHRSDELDLCSEVKETS